MTDARSALAAQWRMFAHNFRIGGAPLYQSLALDAARAMHEDEAFCIALGPWLDEPARLLLPLRLLAAVHRWVLSGRLPDLAAYYRSVGGALPPYDVWPLFRAAVIRHADDLHFELAGVNQHNEVGRAAALSVGFLDLASRYRMPQRLLEVGASAGLLLRWDHYLVQPWYRGMFEHPADAPREHAPPAIVERRGCDLNPIDAQTPEGALRLQSFVWADLHEHMLMLDAAIAISRRVPGMVDRADGANWLAALLMTQTPGLLTIVYHSMMVAASDPESLSMMGEVLDEASARATTKTPLAYVRFEATASGDDQSTRCELVVTTWPGEDHHVLATSDVNGRHITFT